MWKSLTDFLFSFGFTELYPSVWKILSSPVNISANDFKVYSFLECNKVYNCKWLLCHLCGYILTLKIADVTTRNAWLTLVPEYRLIVRSFLYLPFEVVYKKGIDIPVADALSQVTPMDPEDNIQLPIVAINIITTRILMSAESQNNFSNKLDQLRKSTAQDNQLTRLSHYINTGFPCDKKNLLTDLHEFWQYREMLISQIWTHYMWQQDHSPKGDETWDASVHTWGTSKQIKMSTLGKEHSILAQHDLWCTGTHRKMYNMPRTWEITTNHWYYPGTSPFSMAHIGDRHNLLEKNGLPNMSRCLLKILPIEEIGQFYICSCLCRTSHHCNRIRLTPHHQEWQWPMLQFQGVPAISAMI